MSNLRKLAWIIGGVAIAVLGSCMFFRISGPRDLAAYFEMARECHPVWKQFALHRLGRGDSSAELLRRFPPTLREEFGPYGIYSYGAGFTSLTVVSKNRKLLSAGAASCTWGFTFFHSADPELEREYAAFARERHMKFEWKTLTQYQCELLRFYVLNSRWPTNVTEFGCFVTGEVPPSEQAVERNSTEPVPFRRRYRLEQAAGAATVPFNPLGITLDVEENGSICIGLNQDPLLVAFVTKP